MRIVLDTDVLVAAMRSRKGASRQWLRAVLRREVEMALSIPLALQYEEVLLRPEQLRAIQATPEQIHILLDALCLACVPVDISFLWRPLLRDPEDEMVLEAAINGHADTLLTFNERDYHGAERFDLRISRPGTAWKLWKGDVS